MRQSNLPVSLQRAMLDVGSIESFHGLRRQTMHALAQLQEAGSRPPCIVFLGEGNSGKTTAANSLLGDGLLPTAVIANTRYPTLVRFHNQVQAVAVTMSGHRCPLSDETLPSQPLALIEVGLPNPRLKSLEILDTPARFDADSLSEIPGLSPVRIPVWCTVATQAWKESERRYWTALEARARRNALLVVTGIDRIAVPAEIERLMARLKSDAAIHFAGLAYAAIASADATGVPSLPVPPLVALVDADAHRLGARRQRTVAKLRARLLRLSGLAAEMSEEAGVARFPAWARTLS
ncbi:MAG: hypothetical protein ACOYLQ_01635 [Hyphomicrobiaceae bacterium]